MRSFRSALMLASMLLVSACASVGSESPYVIRDSGAANNYFMDGRIMKF